MGKREIMYDRSQLASDLVPQLARALDRAAEHPNDFINQNRVAERRPPTAFVSYSHVIAIKNIWIAFKST